MTAEPQSLLSLPVPHEACIAIFAARETASTLGETIAAALAAASPRTTIDVLVNGNSALANLMASEFRQNDCQKEARIRIWKIVLGDKGHAWNQHIHHVWDGSPLAFYIDGYVRLHPDAIRNMTGTMGAHPDALGGTGLPSVGRSTRQLRQQLLLEGGFHGNLCCMRGTALAALRERGIRLPLGIYRTDSTMGAMLSFGLDPTTVQWNPRKFIAVDPEATWRTDEKKWWRYADIKASIMRLRRQAQGKLENRAVQNHFAVRHQPPET